MTTLSHAWSTLGSTVQAAWDVAAALYPQKDSLGQSHRLTGQQFFIKIGFIELNAFGSYSSVPPLTFPRFSAYGSVLAISGAGAITVQGAGLGVAMWKQVFSVSKPVSTGRRTNFTWWQVLVLAGNSTTVTDITAAYTAQFRALVLGDRVFMKVTPVHKTSDNGVPFITHADHP